MRPVFQANPVLAGRTTPGPTHVAIRRFITGYRGRRLRHSNDWLERFFWDSKLSHTRHSRCVQ